MAITSVALLALVLGVVAPGCDTTDPYDCPDGHCFSTDGDGDSDTDTDVDSDSDTDTDVDSDTDTDVDSDSDGDSDGDSDSEVPPGGCTGPAECVLAMNYNVCCPCIDAMALSSVAADFCIQRVDDVTDLPERPADCGLGCHPDTCVPCEGLPSGHDCVDNVCTPLYDGECDYLTGDGCPDGQVCELRDGDATCVEDPNECYEDGDCTEPGYECDDWLTDGILWCYHPESSCFGHIPCELWGFCEDPEGDGIFQCVDGYPDCRPFFEDLECEAGQRCNDPDGDGRGTCVPG